MFSFFSWLVSLEVCCAFWWDSIRVNQHSAFKWEVWKHPKFCPRTMSGLRNNSFLLLWSLIETLGYSWCQCGNKYGACFHIFCAQKYQKKDILNSFFFVVASKTQWKMYSLHFSFLNWWSNLHCLFFCSLLNDSCKKTNFGWGDRNGENSVLNCFMHRRKSQTPAYRRRSRYNFLPFTVFSQLIEKTSS